MRTKIAQVLGAKPSGVCTLPCTATLREATGLMMVEEVGCVLIDDGGVYVGILSKHDTLVAMASDHGPDPGGALVAQAMTCLHPTVTPEQTVIEALALMKSHRRRYLAVLDGPHMRGIVSKGELTRQVNRNLDQEVEHLIRYMHGPYVQVP